MQSGFYVEKGIGADPKPNEPVQSRLGGFAGILNGGVGGECGVERLVGHGLVRGAAPADGDEGCEQTVKRRRQVLGHLFLLVDTRRHREDEESLAGDLQRSPRILHLKLAKLADKEGGRVLLFVDQLEEIYTLVEDEDQRRQFMLR